MIDQEKIHAQCSSEDPEERRKALNQISENLSLLSDKQQAWDDLIRLATDQEFSVWGLVGPTLDSAFSYVPDKQKACEDIIFLINFEYEISSWAVGILDSAFIYAHDKQKAWEDIIKKADNFVGSTSVVSYLGSVFYLMPDKEKAWNDLHRLTNDKSSYVRSGAAYSLGPAFPHILDKQQAWDDLHRLTLDEDENVRRLAATSIGPAFPHILDKQQAWDDLHRLTSDVNNDARLRAATSIGSAFSLLPDQQQAWEDLIRLADDQDQFVRPSANHSLGKVSIFQASQARTEVDYKNKLEKAIEYFEKESQESWRDNSYYFCLYFYRSFHTILFKKKEAKEEIEKYLAEARQAIKGSKSKELLFDAVNNLAKALNEVQNLENLDLEAKKSEINFYRQYCDRVTELMKDTEEKAPFASMTMKKGLPILNRKLKVLLDEVKKTSKIACQESKDTFKKEFACTINREVQKWEISNLEELVQNIEDLANVLKIKVANLPEKEYILNKIELMKNEPDIVRKIEVLIDIISLIPGGDNISIKIGENTKNVLISTKNGGISTSGDIHIGDNISLNSKDNDTSNKVSTSFSRIIKLLLKHPIIATVIGGIILTIITKKYLP
jgi:hypothetical protein